MNWQMAVGLYNYWVVIFLMMTGFYLVIARGNLIKVIVGLNIFQTSVTLLYVTMGKVRGGTAPIIPPQLATLKEHLAETGADMGVEEAVESVDALQTVTAELVDETVEALPLSVREVIESGQEVVYSHPLPSVLMLTAIVVGVATTAVALALVVRIREAYGTVEEDEILNMDRQAS